MKYTHTGGYGAFLLTLVLGVAILGITLATIQAGMACTNEAGCAKSWCPLKELKKDGKVLIQDKASLCGARNPEKIK